MTLQVVSLISLSSRKQHRTENNRPWLSNCSQVIRPRLLKIQQATHTFAKFDVIARLEETHSQNKVAFGLGYKKKQMASPSNNVLNKHKTRDKQHKQEAGARVSTTATDNVTL